MATKHQIHLRSQNPAPVAYFTGGYGGDGWTPRAEVLHQNVFAVDAPDSELVHALAIQRRQNPFAYPGEWLAQFRLRAALATRHVRNAVLHAKSGDSHPFLGAGPEISESLLPPPWTRNAVQVADAHPRQNRGLGGWLLSASPALRMTLLRWTNVSETGALADRLTISLAKSANSGK